MEKIKVVYIAGAGHSGSTLLDLILGSQKEIESVGEIIQLGDYVENDKKCTCGKTISQCEYWKENIKSYKQLSEIDKCSLFNMSPYANKKERLNFIFNFPSVFIDKQSIIDYGLKNYNLFTSILKNSEKKSIIVDSSKDAMRALKLYLSGLFNIKIIYLFRDGRAFIESKKRKNKDPNREYEQYRGAAIETLSFITTHIARWRVLKPIPKQNVFVTTYRDLACRPSYILNTICRFIGVKFDEETLDSSSSKYFSNIRHHNIDGNRLRFTYIDKIEFKKKWPTELKKSEITLFHLLGGNVVNKYFENLANKKKYF